LLAGRLKLRRLQVRNFLSFGDEPIEMNFGNAPVSLIVGPNNSGKSNLFRTLNFAGEAIARTHDASEVARYLPTGIRDFEIAVGVELSEAEHQALLDFMVCSTQLYSPGGTNVDQQLMTLAVKEVLPRQKERLFGGIGREVEIVIRGTQRDAPPITHLYKLQWDNETFTVQRDNYFAKVEIPESGGFSSFELGSLLFEGLKLKHSETPQGAGRQPGVADFEPPNPPKVINERLATVADPVRSMFAGVSVHFLNFQELDQKVGITPEFQRLKNFLEGRGFRENGITLGGLLALIYTSSIVWIADLRGTPSDHVPIAWERPVERATLPVYGTTTWPKIRRVVADNLAGWLFELSTAGSAADQLRYQEIQKEFHDFTHLWFRIYLGEDEVVEEPNLALVRVPPRQVGFGGTDTPEFAAIGMQVNKNRKMVKTAGIQITDGKSAWPVEFSSAGTVEVLCLLTGIIGTKDGILLLDEPVQNMHPEFQYLFLRLLDQYTKAGGNQALVTTHSPFLITRENLENTWYVTKKGNATVILSVMRKLAESPGMSQKITQQLDSSDVRSILFARGVVFVEGPSDKWVLEEIDRKAASAGRGPRLLENEWPVISMNTRDNTETFLSLVEELGLNHVFFLDRDAEPMVKGLIQAKGGESWGEEIMHKNGFFLLKSDLDGLLGITDGSKPRKALQRVGIMRLEDVPPEFMEFMAFLEKRTSNAGQESYRVRLESETQHNLKG
jgi:ABC-type transport system involved in cytochrome c biogenesis ATPase subunit